MTSELRQKLAAPYRGKRVLVLGHTGFKGSWLTVWLHELGAHVTGVSLPPDTRPAMFESLRLEQLCAHRIADVRDADALAAALREAQPDVVFHLAAQSLVRRSYEEPALTWATNVLGTVHVLEAVRMLGRPCAVVVATSDKCYENDGGGRPVREDAPLGGHDPYSASKAAAELAVSSYRRSWFDPAQLSLHSVALASVRAGNVIGGGDWALDRIVPDAVRAFASGGVLRVRNPASTRPFQHVIEPLAGYLLLGARLRERDAAPLCRAFNFGPERAPEVRELVERLAEAWGPGARWEAQPDAGLHEARALHVDASAARAQLSWAPRWDLRESASQTAAWYRAASRGAEAEELRALTRRQIADWLEAA